ncbi:ankyrin repeat-containing domain protein [Hypoxylon trugodes]|uniref:ankyrin repeat-containing domain protein n=1 Tax=Hypoxylon trugodes TaxID=326681 RepID=UPI002191B50B|nr:ankyrin repeat-containing domain protein [Hypoxylon trugodes]KAI1383892.1 ankyrin repeat-containing domain protein [Hypoxylon trugodes]
MGRSVKLEAFPAPVFMSIIEHLVVSIGIYKAVLLRRVNRSFNATILHAICVSQVVDMYDPATPHVKYDIPPSLRGAILLIRSRSPNATKQELPSVILSVNREIDRLTQPTEERRDEQHRIISEAVAVGINPFKLNYIEKGLKDIDEETHAQNLFCAAIVLGNLPLVKSMLEDLALISVRVNANNLYFGPPLQIACARGHIDIVRYLLSHGANIQEDSEDLDWNPNLRLRVFQKHVYQSPEGSPLRAALHGGHEDIANLLLEPEYRPSPTPLKMEFVESIVAAVRSGLYPFYQRLIQMTGKPLSDYPGLGGKLLREAVEYNQEGIMRMLLEKDGVDVNSVSDEATLSTRSALYTAACMGKAHVVRVLIGYGTKLRPPHYGPCPLEGAARGGHEEAVEILLDHGEPRALAFKCAVESGQVHLAKWLVARYPSIIMEKYGRMRPINLMSMAIMNKNLDMIAFLLDAGLPLNYEYIAHSELPMVEAKTSAAEWVANFLLTLGFKDEEIDESARPAYYSEVDITKVLSCRGVRLTKRTWNWVSKY